MDDRHFQGYSNWASYSFSVVWSNDQALYFDFIEQGAKAWEKFNGNPTEVGRVVVAYAREHYAGSFPDLETEEEWEEIDLEEVGDEIRAAAEAEGKYEAVFALYD